MNDRLSMWVYVVSSAVLAGVVYLALTVWGNASQETTPEAVERVRADFHTTLDNLASGNHTAAASSPPSIPWLAAHPAAGALIAFGALCIVCRLYVFMRTLEDRY
jgi:hypothetical protein